MELRFRCKLSRLLKLVNLACFKKICNFNLCSAAVTMQDLFVIYNNESKQLGWVRAQCDKAQELESVIDSRL